MAVNQTQAEYRPRVGISDIYIAEVTQDDSSAYVADTPEYVAPAAEASQEPSSSSETLYGDDQPIDVMFSEGATKVTLTFTGISVQMLAKLTGRVFDATTGRMYDHGGVPPFVAVSFRSLKANGKYRYYQFLKGQFSMPKEDAATKAEKSDPKKVQLSYTAIRTTYKFDLGDITDSVKRIVGDEDTVNFSGASWFSQVQTPAVSTPSALALSVSDPADGATAVLVSKTITLTFNNALENSSISNVVLVKADGTVVACTNSLDTTRKIMTVNPNANLDAASTYILAIGVKDIYGDDLNTAINFATA